MTTTNPRHKPLHRIRRIRNDARAALRYPQLANDLFTPTSTVANPQTTPQPPWARDFGGLIAATPLNMPPQPTMNQFYGRGTGTSATTQQSQPGRLQSIPFADDEAEQAYRAASATRGFIPLVRGGPNQFTRMLFAGLNPRVGVMPEEAARVAEHEKKVQRVREKISMKTIMDESRFGVNGRKREMKMKQVAFPLLEGQMKRYKKDHAEWVRTCAKAKAKKRAERGSVKKSKSKSNPEVAVQPEASQEKKTEGGEDLDVEMTVQPVVSHGKEEDGEDRVVEMFMLLDVEGQGRLSNP